MAWFKILDKCSFKQFIFPLRFVFFFIKMFLKPFNILMNVMVITVAISTFVCSVECVPISNGETVPDDGESKM